MGVRSTELTKPIIGPGSRLSGLLRPACLPGIGSCGGSLPVNSSWDWSPEQISGWLKRRYPSDESMRVSLVTIYRSLFIQARGSAEKGADPAPAVEARLIRRSRQARTGRQSRGQIVDAISISERPGQRLKIVPFLVIGREICSAAPATVSIATSGGTTFAFHHHWSKCPARTQRPLSTR